MHRLFLLGLNHSTAPLAVREKLAFDAPQRAAALEAFRARFGGAEAVLLSTCNRVELYAARRGHGDPAVEDVADFLAAFHGLGADQFRAEFRPHLYEKRERDVIAHLFSVAASLDSMVLGETQILGQVREAYDVARRQQATGPLLNPLFQQAIEVGKRVMADTPLGKGRLSVASVAVDYARRIFDRFTDKTVLSIGAGKMAALVLQHFRELSPGRLLVCNRNPEKAAALAQKFGGEAVAFGKLSEHLVAADIVVTSTGSPHPIITRGQFEGLRRQRRYRPIFMIDIALPRDVEPAVGELENVYLRNIDDLQQVVAETQSQRTEAIDAARKIVSAGVEEFAARHRAREMGPLIDALYKKLHRIAQDEVARTVRKLPHAGETERAHLVELAHRIVSKTLHDPVHALRRSAAGHGSAEAHLHALEHLFRLGPEADDALAGPAGPVGEVAGGAPVGVPAVKLPAGAAGAAPGEAGAPAGPTGAGPAGPSYLAPAARGGKHEQTRQQVHPPTFKTESEQARNA